MIGYKMITRPFLLAAKFSLGFQTYWLVNFLPVTASFLLQLFGDCPRNVVFTVRVVGFPVHVVFSVYVIFSAEIYVFPPPGLFSGCDLAPGDTQHLVRIFLF